MVVYNAHRVNSTNIANTIMSFVRCGSASNLPRSRLFTCSTRSWMLLTTPFIRLSLQCLKVSVFQNDKTFYGKTVGVVVASA